MEKKLLRSHDRIIAGVCGGLANYFDADPTIVRLIYVLLTFFTVFSGILLYPLLWIIMPEE
ncbi:MAG: PspC domain-containing protein [Prevotella sp.]|nr:PspC domain-containing protein [Prevotella sp.]MBQ9532786.1 PspC domain-containing protein [Prevotella sp.]